MDNYILINLALVIALIAAGFFARKQWMALRAYRIFAQMQPVALEECARIAGDETNSLNLRMFARHLAILSLSQDTIRSIGANVDQLKMALSSNGDEDLHMLTAKERGIVDRPLGYVAMMTLLYSPKAGASLMKSFREASKKVRRERDQKKKDERCEVKAEYIVRKTAHVRRDKAIRPEAERVGKIIERELAAA